MGQPTNSQIHVNKPLTNISVAWFQDAKNYIADKVFPMVPVQKQSDRYFVYDKGDLLRDEAQERAPGTESAGGGYSIDNTPTYYCKKYSYHKDVTDDERENADAPLDMDRDATQFVSQKMAIKRESVFLTNYFTTGIWTGTTTGTDIVPSNKWNAANGDPVADVDSQREKIFSITGFMPQKLVLSADVFAALKNNADIKDRVKYTQKAVITEELLAGLFGVEQVLIARAIYNSAAKGQTASVGYLATAGQALLLYASPTPSLQQPSAGYTFAWTGLLGSGAYANRIKKFRMEELESDRIEGTIAFDSKVVAPECGALFSSCLA